MNYFAIMLRQLVAAHTDNKFQLAMKEIDEKYETEMLCIDEWNTLQDVARMYNPISYALYTRSLYEKTKGAL